MNSRTIRQTVTAGLIAAVLAVTGCVENSSTRALSPEALMERGIAAFRAGQLDAASTDLSQALDRDPSLYQAYVYLLRTALARGAWDDAIDVLVRTKKAATGPNGAKVMETMRGDIVAEARTLLERGDVKDAVALLQGAIAHVSSPEVISAWVDSLLAHGQALMDRREWAQAIEQFSGVIDRAPETLSAYIGLAKAFFASGEFRNALDAIRRALKLEPGNRDAGELLGKLLRT